MSKNTLLALAMIAALAVPGQSFAQSSQPGSGPNMMWGGPNMMWGGPGMMWNRGSGYGPGMMGNGMMGGCPMMGAMMGGGNYQQSAAAWLDGQFAYAHSEIGVTDAQEPAWKAYVSAVKDRSDQMIAGHQSMMGAMWQGGLPFDQAYSLHIDIMQAHLDAIRATRDAALKLYGALTPDQQKKASWVLPQSMCMM
jgi:hypothetical protein